MLDVLGPAYDRSKALTSDRLNVYLNINEGSRELILNYMLRFLL